MIFIKNESIWKIEILNHNMIFLLSLPEFQKNVEHIVCRGTKKVECLDDFKNQLFKSIIK